MAEDELINVGHLKQSMRRMDDEFIDNEEFKSALREAQESGEFDGVGVKSVVQTTTSSADGGDNIITVTLTNGTTSTFTVKNGSRGSTGNRGSQIYFGTKITGTSTTAAVFSSSGVSSALVNDMYINTSTWNIYQCTTAGAASAAKWKYIGNIKGATGAAGSNATVTVDSALSNTSTNPVQNKVVNAALSGKAPAYSYGTEDLVAGSSALATGKLHFVYE